MLPCLVREGFAGLRVSGYGWGLCEDQAHPPPRTLTFPPAAIRALNLLAALII